jgi:hypothetical protein
MIFFAKLYHSNFARFAKWFHKFFYYNLNSNFVKIEIAMLFTDTMHPKIAKYTIPSREK